jgi:hypothetical protein
MINLVVIIVPSRLQKVKLAHWCRLLVSQNSWPAVCFLNTYVHTYMHAEGRGYNRERTVFSAGSLFYSATVPGITKTKLLCVTGVKADRAWCLLTEQRNVYISLLHAVD